MNTRHFLRLRLKSIPGEHCFENRFRVIRWLVCPNDVIHEGQPIAIFKPEGFAFGVAEDFTFEFVASFTGRLRQQLVSPNEIVAANDLIAVAIQQTIPAECLDDHGLHYAQFDAASWFEQATDEQIKDCVWGENCAVVAQFFRETNPVIEVMFAYIDEVNERKDFNENHTGFECFVDEISAVEWLRRHRPHLLSCPIEAQPSPDTKTIRDITDPYRRKLSEILPHKSGDDTIMTRIWQPILVPNPGNSEKHANLMCWAVQKQQVVRKGELIAVVSFERQDVDIVAPATGRVHSLLHQVGSTVEVGSALAFMLEQVIPAECYDDRHTHEAYFDAVSWFNQATDQEIKALADCGWGDNYPADAVAEFCRSFDSSVETMFDCMAILNHNRGIYKDVTGFECHVDKDCALDWLCQHRPQLFELLSKSDSSSDPWAKKSTARLTTTDGKQSVRLTPELLPSGFELGADPFKVVRWNAEPGDLVHKGQPIAVVENPAFTFEVYAPFTGRLINQLVLPDQIIYLDSVLFVAIPQVIPSTAETSQPQDSLKPVRLRRKLTEILPHKSDDDTFDFDGTLQNLFRLSAIAATLQETIAREKASLLRYLQKQPDLMAQQKTYETEQGAIVLQTRKYYQMQPDVVQKLLDEGMLTLNILIQLAFPNASVQNAEALKALLGETRFGRLTSERETQVLTVKPSKNTKNLVAQEFEFWRSMRPGVDSIPPIV